MKLADDEFSMSHLGGIEGGTSCAKENPDPDPLENIPDQQMPTQADPTQADEVELVQMVTGQKEQSEHCAPTPEKHLNSLEQYANALVAAVAKGIDSELGTHSLNPIDFATMRLFLIDNEWTATELAQVLPVEVSAISRIVRKLVDRGLLYRRRSITDRRVVYLKLTKAGTTLGLALQESMTIYEDRLKGGICESDLDIFEAVIVKILANCDAKVRD